MPAPSSEQTLSPARRAKLARTAVIRYDIPGPGSIISGICPAPSEFRREYPAMPPTDLRDAVRRHITYSLGLAPDHQAPRKLLNAAALAVRDRMVERLLETETRYRRADAKRLYYLSMEFLIGRSLRNNLVNLGLLDECARRLAGARRRLRTRSKKPKSTRRWATAASAGWPPASSIRSPPSACPASATASTTNTACSGRKSATANRSRSPTTGAPTPRPG